MNPPIQQSNNPAIPPAQRVRVHRRRYAPGANADATLAAVRELSERAALRSAPRALRCIAVQTRELTPVPASRRQWAWLLAKAAPVFCILLSAFCLS